MTAYTSPATGRSEQITDSRAIATEADRKAAAQAAQAAFEMRFRPTHVATAQATNCARCGGSIVTPTP